jgi:hypothetical protein
MSQDGVSFEEILSYLVTHPRADGRAYAAELLGEHVDSLSDDEYQRAAHALNDALADADPQVVMAAMLAPSQYNRQALRQVEQAERQADETKLIAIALCKVCQKPEMLADITLCPHADCPYK